MSTPAKVRVEWKEALQFVAGREGRPTVVLDSDGLAGPSPIDALLSALGTCISVDVVEILTKRRTPVERFLVEVVAVRVDTIPRRLKHVTLNFHIDGKGIERVHADRAIELAVTKYCSVRDSLAPDIPVVWNLALNEPAAPGQDGPL